MALKFHYAVRRSNINYGIANLTKLRDLVRRKNVVSGDYVYSYVNKEWLHAGKMLELSDLFNSLAGNAKPVKNELSAPELTTTDINKIAQPAPDQKAQANKLRKLEAKFKIEKLDLDALFEDVATDKEIKLHPYDRSLPLGEYSNTETISDRVFPVSAEQKEKEAKSNIFINPHPHTSDSEHSKTTSDKKMKIALRSEHTWFTYGLVILLIMTITAVSAFYLGINSANNDQPLTAIKINDSIPIRDIYRPDEVRENLDETDIQ